MSADLIVLKDNDNVQKYPITTMDAVVGLGAELSKIKSLDEIYPIGSIYLTVATTTTGSVSPAQFFGGTWERLPDGYALWTASSGAGDTISAGLPNISGGYDMRTTVNADTFANTFGAFSTTQSGSGTKWSQGHSTGNTGKNLATVRFNAHNSNDIYSDNISTVQPPAYKIYAWKRVS